MAASPMFDEVVTGAIWTTERPVWFGGVRLRSRTTVVRLVGGHLWVHSPAPPSGELCAALDALGEVRWIVVPNRFHHLGTPAMAARYPRARVVGPRSAEARNPRLRIALATDDAGYLQATPELTAHPLNGVPFLDETAFFHRESRSLIAADLLISACARDHWSWRLAARLWRRYETVKTPPDVRTHVRRSAGVARSIATMCALPIERILVAHADPITDRPAELLAAAWAFATPRGG